MSQFLEQFENIDLEIHGIRLPKFNLNEEDYSKLDIPRGISSLELFRLLVSRGFDKRVEDKDFDLNRLQEYRDRLKYEMSIIEPTDFVDYLLIVWDVVNTAKNNNIAIGPGRGSAASSLVLYCLKITDIDPVSGELYFERFLSEARTTPKIVSGSRYYLDACDTDLDVEDTKREQLVNILKEKYKGHFCKISTLGTLQSRKCIKEVCKIVLSYSERESMEISSMVPSLFGKVYPLKKTVEEVPAFAKFIKDNPKAYKIALKISELPVSIGSHASAYIVAYEPLIESIPCMMGEREMVTSFDMNFAQLFNIKLDLLGLKAVGIINEVCQTLGLKTRDFDLSYDNVYKYLQDVRLPYGLFQISGDCNWRVVNKVKPKNLDHMAGVVALARPGALQFTDRYSKFVETGESESVHPFFDDIFESAGGLCLAKGSQIFDPVKSEYFDISNREKCLSAHVISLDKNNNKSIDKVIGWKFNGVKEVFEIKLKFLTETLKSTNNHKFLTPTGWKELKELSPGDCIAITNDLKTKSGKSYDKDKLRVLAYLIADGSLTRGSSVDLVSKNIKFLSNYKESVDRAFPNTVLTDYIQIREVTRVKARKREGHYHAASDLTQWLRELGLKGMSCGCGSYTKFIPEFIFELNYDCICFFIASLFDGDGTVSGKVFSYKTMSSLLAQGLQKLLLRIGFSSKVYGNDSRCNGFIIKVDDSLNFYKDVISHFSCRDSFHKCLNFLQPSNRIDKKSAIQILLDNNVNISRPKTAYKKYKLSYSFFTTEYKSVETKVIKRVGEILDNKELLNIDNCIWREIESIESVGEEEVFDIETEKYHNFSVNGIFAHNCLFQEFLMRAMEKIGFSKADGEKCRKIIGKKIHKEVGKWEELIFNKAKEKNLDPEIPKALWRILNDSASYSFNKCLIGSTLIICERGELAIKDVVVGDRIKFYDETNNKDDYTSVLAIYKSIEILFQFNFENGKSVCCSLKHKFLTKKGMREIIDIYNNYHSVLFEDGEYYNIKDYKCLGATTSYDLEVDHPNHNFYANGFVTSNSHSYSYGTLAAQTTYLKFKYPQHFYLACLRQAASRGDFIEHFEQIQHELPYFGIQLLPPNIAKSGLQFSIEGKDIRFGIGEIKGISDKSIDKLQEFTSQNTLTDSDLVVFNAAKEAKLGIGIQSALIQSGALGHNVGERSKKVLEAQIWNILTPKEKLYCLSNESKYGGSVITALKDFLNWTSSDGKKFTKESRLNTIRKDSLGYLQIYNLNHKNELLASYFYEKKLLGFSYSTTLKMIFGESPDYENIRNIKEIDEFVAVKDSYHLVATVKEVIEGTSKNGNKYLKLRLSDETGETFAMLLGDKLARYLEKLPLPKEDDIVSLIGQKGDSILWVNKMEVQNVKVYTKLSELKNLSKEEKTLQPS